MGRPGMEWLLFPHSLCESLNDPVFLPLFFQARFDALVCPPRRPGEPPELWTCGVAHILDNLVLSQSSLTPLFVLLPFPQVQGGGDVVLEHLCLALNQMADARAGRESADKPDYPDDDDDEDYNGPLTPTDWPGLFSDDVSCLMLL